MAKAKRPKVKAEIDWKPLIDACEYHMDMHFNEDYGDKEDADHYIYEKALESIYGKDLWEEFNKRYNEFEA